MPGSPYQRGKSVNSSSIRFINKLSRLSIAKKLFISFAVFISLPVIITASRGFLVFSDFFEEKITEYSHDILYQVSKTMESKLEKIGQISFSIIINQDIQDSLYSLANMEPDDYELIKIRNTLENILASYVLYHPEISATFLLAEQGEIYGIDKLKQNYGIAELDFYEIHKGEGAEVWLGNTDIKNTIILSRSIYSVKTLEHLSDLVICIQEEYLSSLLFETLSFDKGEIYIIDGSGRIIIDEDKNRIGALFDPEHKIQSTIEFNFSIQDLEGQEQYIAVGKAMENGWKIVASIPRKTYLDEILNYRNTGFIFAFALLTVAIAMSWALSRSIYKPILILTSVIEKFGKGDLAVRCPPLPQDEIGELSMTFNQMTRDINELVNKVRTVESMKRDVELRLLQMQINPHFLFNTLETINWLARTQGTEDIGIIAKSLGDLLRITIYGKDYVTLTEELGSLENYLKIQKFRYGEKLNYSIEMSEKTSSLQIPKLLIQPFVENAILHGIDPALGNGFVSISSELTGSNLIVRVEDNGVGIPSKHLKKMIDGCDNREEPEQNSIGIRNVQKRIKMLFGDEYGIEIRSELGEGSVVIMILPELNNVE
jgi:two-component system, sensor histidine kinase YesM